MNPAPRPRATAAAPRLSRRAFLRTSATAAAALCLPTIIPASALGRAGRPAPSSRIQLGVVGLRQGMHDLRNFLGDPRVQVVGVCDLLPERRREGLDVVHKAYGTRDGVFDTWDKFDLIARDNVDAVCLALPDHWHALPFLAAARLQKHIYTEKPCALTIGEGRAMVAAVERYNIICQVGSQQRSAGEFRRAVDLVRAGYLGEVKRVEVGILGGPAPAVATPLQEETPPEGFDFDRWLGPAPEATFHAGRVFNLWRWHFDYSGGKLTDWIGHHGDIGLWALDLSRTGPTHLHEARAEFASDPLYNTTTSYSFEAHYANGVVMRVADRSQVREGVKFFGSEGTIWVTRGQTEFSSRALRNAIVPPSAHPLPAARNHSKNFIDCIYSGEEPVCPIEDGHRIASLAHLANAAFRSGRTSLEWDPVRERLVNAPDAARFLQRVYRAPWTLEV